MTTDFKPIFLADRPTCSAVASAAYRERRDRPFLSSKQPAEAPVFLFPLASVTVTKVLFLISKTWTKSVFFFREHCSSSSEMLCTKFMDLKLPAPASPSLSVSALVFSWGIHCSKCWEFALRSALTQILLLTFIPWSFSSLLDWA